MGSWQKSISTTWMSKEPTVFEVIPTSRPNTPLLDQIEHPADIRTLVPDQLSQLAHELRHFLLYTVGQTGGHFGAGLGVVELTIALHRVFDTPEDQLIWDVGHQTYPHKILTGRREHMAKLRRPHGPAPFPSRDESEFDVFGTGHSSTSISAALGIQLAKAEGDKSQTVVVIGDGAMTAGMAFEALNHVSACGANLLIVLNDNAMSISENVGGLADYFAREVSVPGSIFEDLGIRYSGPVDGHNIDELLETLATLKTQSGPRLLHVQTRKGKGYRPAEASPIDSHSLTKLEKQNSRNAPPTYSAIFGNWITTRAQSDTRLFAITPAMREGSGLASFAEQFPHRFHDVAIAEQHAVTFAAGLAAGGAKPVVAIYSTFLQRAYDQLIHDVAIQHLDVLFAVDRASLLEDGPTHSGVFDLSFVRAIPNMVIMAPATDWSMTAMLNFGYEHEGPAMVRYPRGSIPAGDEEAPIEFGKGVLLRHGQRVAVLSFGATRAIASQVAADNDYTQVDMRFVKPLDEDLIRQLADTHELLVTVEENSIAGGAGSAINEFLSLSGINIATQIVGVPDRFIEPDEPSKMRSDAGLAQQDLDDAIRRRLKNG